MVGHHWSAFDHGQAISNCDIARPWSNMVDPLKKNKKQKTNKKKPNNNKNNKLTILITIAKNKYHVTVLYKVWFWTWVYKSAESLI